MKLSAFFSVPSGEDEGERSSSGAEKSSRGAKCEAATCWVKGHGPKFGREVHSCWQQSPQLPSHFQVRCFIYHKCLLSNHFRSDTPGFHFSLLNRPRDPPQSCPEDGGDGTVEVELQLPYPFSQSLLAAQEGDDDKQQEVPHVSWHPRPLGVSTETRAR